MVSGKKGARTSLGKRSGGDSGGGGGELGLGGDGATAGAYGSVDLEVAASEAGAWLRKTAHWLENSEDTDPALCISRCCECEEDFKPRRIKAPFVLAWLVLQAMGMLFQASMFYEIWGHLDTFEAALAANCGPQHQQQGICLGPSWNLSYSQVFEFPPTMSTEEQPEFDFVIPADRTLSFDTLSQPPTFLMGVEPLPPNQGAGWKLVVTEQGANDAGLIPPLLGHGKKYSVTSTRAPCVRPEPGGRCHWTGSVVLTSKFYSETVSLHAFVVDSRIAHLEDIHKQPQCDFEKSWQNFNERGNGSHHQVLINAWHAAAFFLLVSVACMGIMVRRFFFYVEGGKLLSRLIVVKYAIQDIPQQLCIAAYLYGWYASNGLRCQMCLFHPMHCDDQYPLHFSNLMLCIFTMLSACANQLLIQMKPKSRHSDEEEEFFQCCVRFSLLSASTLPFSTATLVLAGPVLQLRSGTVYMLAGIPALFGWSACLCLPMAAACDEDM